MSTRCTTHFHDGSDKVSVAIIYRHSDGYPTGAGAELIEFIKVCSGLRDPRLDDAPYLAAKFVVYLAGIFAEARKGYPDQYGPSHLLNFLSVGVMAHDPGDIEYRYHVRYFAGKKPRLSVQEIGEADGAEISIGAAIEKQKKEEAI